MSQVFQVVDPREILQTGASLGDVRGAKRERERILWIVKAVRTRHAMVSNRSAVEALNDVVRMIEDGK